MIGNLKETITLLKYLKNNYSKHRIKEKEVFYLDYAIILLEELLKRDIKENPPKKRIRKNIMSYLYGDL